MKRRRKSKPGGLNEKAASSQHSTPMDYQHSRTYTVLEPSGQMEAEYPWPAEKPPITRLPRYEQLEAQVQHLEAQVLQPSNSEHLPNISELIANVDLGEAILEDWKRFHAIRDTAKSSGHDTSKINSARKFPLGYDGTTLELGRPDDINTSHASRKQSLPPFSSMLMSEPFDFSRTLPPPIPSRSFNNLGDELRYTHVLGQARYGKFEASDKVKNRLPPSKLDRRSSGLSAILGTGNADTGAIMIPGRVSPSQLSRHPTPTLLDGGLATRPSSQASSPGTPRSKFSAFDEPSRPRQSLIPLPSSNAVMMRFESSARELEAVSCAATDATHRSISDDEEIIPATHDAPHEPHDGLSNEDESPTALPIDMHTSEDEVGRSSQLRPSEEKIRTDFSIFEDIHDSEDALNRSPQFRPSVVRYRAIDDASDEESNPTGLASVPVKCFCHSTRRSGKMALCTTCQTLQHTECYYRNENDLGHGQTQSQHLQSSAQRTPRQERQHVCVDCVISNDRFDPDEFNAATRRLHSTRPQSRLKDSITTEILDEMSDGIIGLPGPKQAPLDGSFHQDTPPSKESISNENPEMLNEANSIVVKDIGSGNNHHPFMAEAYTDSGYASNTTRAFKLSEVAGQTDYVGTGSRSLSAMGEDHQCTEQEYDTKSIYSDASAIPPLTKARYIEGLADDLAQAIQPYQLHDKDLRQFFGILPELLKAFALTFGHHESATMHRDVMVFIHRYRRQIVKTLNNHLSMEEVEHQNTDQADKMSLNEIMNLWHRSGEPAQDERLDNFEHNDNLDIKNFDGRKIRDEDEEEEDDNDFEVDETELPGLAAYRSLIRGSPAHSWFLDNIRRECTLLAPEPNIIGEIRNAILNALPSSPKISRRKPAEIFNVGFMVDWDPVAFLREEEYTEKPEDAIERAITLTGSTVSAQALTCGGYLRQTWPSTGEQILYLIKSLVSGKNRASGNYLLLYNQWRFHRCLHLIS
ncbi:hypothetical protein EIK77_005345 [Talaromyces pinophilus]|nr:hypothetical protein EIK77_005345 [Talaromyces pinophilus]